ncbi:hypothetical protein [Actinoplanes sp. HUAS TT8]|uniref:hypothetical protein n=1 Tax=Actinoplanes sp. HUAS TT8 TaxID=3447453 RepID=UPI003F52014B
MNAFLALGAILATTACTDLDRASAAGVGPADAVLDIAGQLADSAGLTYTATYRLGDGGTAHIIQAPSRTAYRWPGGRLIVTPEATIRCAATCVTGAPGPAEPLPATGMITPGAVEAKLRAAAADPALAITERDTTIAGRHAACVKLTGAFEVCVTGDGTMAALTGVLAGTTLDLTLTDLTPTADDAAFKP